MRSDFPIKIGDKTYTLRYKYLAIETIQDMAGDVPDHRSVKVILYAGLRKHHPDITLDDCGLILDDADDFKALTEEIADIFKQATGQGEDTKKKLVKDKA